VAEVVEFVEAGEAGDEEAGVDGASDALAGGDGGDDGHAGDLAHVLGGEAAAVLGDQDDPVRTRAGAGEQRGQSEVAGPSEDDVGLAYVGRRAHGVAPAVDDNGVRDVRLGGERESTRHVDDLAVVDGGNAQQGSGLLIGCGHEHDAPVRRCPERERGRHGRRSLTAARTGDHDGASRLRRLVTGDHAVTSMNVGCRRGTGRASPTRPVAPSDLMSGGHRAAAISSSAW
jgi:hypothetical protein